MSKQNRFYDQEFKDNAARYCLEKAPSITQGAKDLNLNKCSVFKWVNEYKEQMGIDQNKEREKKQQTKKEADELARELRKATKRNLELEEENALLKKVIGIFSQRPQ
jgi:transposase-like protein